MTFYKALVNHLQTPHLKCSKLTICKWLVKWSSCKNMTSGFLSISIAIIVLGQPILHLTKEETFVGALASNSELIKPKWSTIGLNTYDRSPSLGLLPISESLQTLNLVKHDTQGSDGAWSLVWPHLCSLH